MRRVMIRTVDDRVIELPEELSEQDFCDRLGVPSAALGTATPLKHGGVHRAFRFIGPGTKIVNLSGYCDVFLSNRQWLGRIEPV